MDAIAGIESRGFLFGMPLALALGIPFVTVRKKGKLPWRTVSYKYDLEYGSAEVEMHVDAVKPGMRVLVHDDLLATGGTAMAAAELIRMQGGTVAGFSFLIELSFLNGVQRLKPYNAPIISLVKLLNNPASRPSGRSAHATDHHREPGHDRTSCARSC